MCACIHVVKMHVYVSVQSMIYTPSVYALEDLFSMRFYEQLLEYSPYITILQKVLHWSLNFDCTQLHGTGSHLDHTQTSLGLDEYSRVSQPSNVAVVAEIIIAL